MTNPTPRKISELDTLASIADGDLIPIVDISDTSLNSTGETKKIPFSAIKSNVQAGIDTDFTETDPVFGAHVASDITSTDIGQWDAAYAWGNHATQGYLQSIAAQSINALNDVAINSSTLANDQVIKWNGTSWVNGTGSGGGTTINELNDVGDVSISSVASGQVLKYDGNNWVNSADAGGIALSDLSVTTNSASGGGSLTYGSGTGVFSYTPPDLSNYVSSLGSVGGHTDVNITSITPTSGQALVWNTSSSNWIPGNIVTGGGTVIPSGTSDGDTIVWAGGAWRVGPNIGGYSYGAYEDPYFDNVSLLLEAEPREVGGSAADHFNLLDKSKNSIGFHNNATITRNREKNGLASMRFTSNSNYVHSDFEYAQNVDDFDFTTGDFTIEAWVSIDDLSTHSSSTIFELRDGSNGTLLDFYIDCANDQIGFFHGAGSIIADQNVNLVNDVWFHVALVRKSGVIYIFKDGLKLKEQAFTTYIDEPAEFWIGRNGGGTRATNGYMDSLRVTKGVGRYDGNFTPPSSSFPQAIDPYWDSVQLLIDAHETAGTASGIKDISDENQSLQENSVSTSSFNDQFVGKLVGNEQMGFTGDDDYIRVMNVDSALDLSNSNFTIDFRAMLDYTPANQEHHIISGTGTSWSVTSTGINYRMYLELDTSPQVFKIVYGSTTYTINIPNTMPIVSSQGYHFAITRSSNIIEFWIDGQSAGTVDIGSSSNLVATGAMLIGNSVNANDRTTGRAEFAGYMSWFRITKNVVRYTNGNTYSPVFMPPGQGGGTQTTGPEKYIPLTTLKTAAAGAADFAAFKTAIAAL